MGQGTYVLPLAAMMSSVLHQILDVNVKCTALLVKEAVPHLKESQCVM